jgi:hypothetical protein
MGQMSEDLTMRECLMRDINDLKRERDEAREAFAIATSNCVDAQQRLREMEDQRDFAMSEMERLKR